MLVVCMSNFPFEIPPTPENLRLLDEAHQRLLARCALLSDTGVAEPSKLPGWTKGHVLNHLARQAPALERLLTWAATGVETPQYSSRQERDKEIEEGADRSAADLVGDFVRTAERLRKAITQLPDVAWEARVRPITGETCTPRRILVIRIRELEVHHIDLALGYTFADMPSPALRIVLADVSSHLRGTGAVPAFEMRDPNGELLTSFGDSDTGGRTVTGPAADALGWLTGRTRGRGLSCPQGLPELPGWI